VDLTSHDVEIDRIEDRHAKEALGDAAHLEQRRALCRNPAAAPANR
jgi:hypothetical protein